MTRRRPAVEPIAEPAIPAGFAAPKIEASRLRSPTSVGPLAEQVATYAAALAEVGTPAAIEAIEAIAGALQSLSAAYLLADAALRANAPKH